MSLSKYKITFRNGSTQQVTCSDQGPQGDWLVFADGSGIVLRVPAADVESVQREDVADSTQRRVKSASA